MDLQRKRDFIEDYRIPFFLAVQINRKNNALIYVVENIMWCCRKQKTTIYVKNGKKILVFLYLFFIINTRSL